MNTQAEKLSVKYADEKARFQSALSDFAQILENKIALHGD